jgi:hypothetical protein
LSKLLISHIGIYSVLFGLVSVVAFWFAIQLSWSVVGKPWYSAAWRLFAALSLFALGFVMIFFTAFGA